MEEFPISGEELRKQWLQSFKDDGLMYFVLKADQFLEVLNDDMIIDFLRALEDLANYRESIGKTRDNEYYVVNRDDVPHIKSREEFLKIIGYKK